MIEHKRKEKIRKPEEKEGKERESQEWYGKEGLQRLRV